MHTFLPISALNGGEWSAFRCRRFTPALDGKEAGTRGQFRRDGEHRIPNL
jgi:hypothetical protein